VTRADYLTWRAESPAERTIPVTWEAWKASEQSALHRFVSLCLLANKSHLDGAMTIKAAAEALINGE
jgi:hypothetical protein